MMRFVRSAADASSFWSETRRPRSRGGMLTTALVVIAVTMTLALVGLSASNGLLAWDFRFAYLPAAEHILDGESPYPALDDPILEDQKGYVYPPQLVVALLPLTVLPVAVVAMLVALCMLGLVGLTLWLLDVRDVRCYAAAVLWVPTISGFLLGNLSIPLAFAVAALWRYRNALWPAATALGLAVSAKLLLWPIFVWMLATRRLRAAGAAVLVGVVVTLAAWASIGFDGLREYPDLLRRLSEIQSGKSYSMVGMASTLGLGDTVGRILALVLGATLLTWCIVFARRGDEARSFTCAIAATLALSPIVWLHYLVVLLVPVAIARPRFSALWLLPVLLWVSPRPGYAEGFQTFVPAIAASIVFAVVLARPRVGGVSAAEARA